MTAALKSHHEPEEREDPIAALLNTLLVQVEDTMRLIVAHGGEAPLRARIEKVFPPATSKASDALTEQTRRVDRIVADADLALALIYGAEALRKHMHRLGEDNAACRAKTQTCIDILIARLRQKPESEVAA